NHSSGFQRRSGGSPYRCGRAIFARTCRLSRALRTSSTPGSSRIAASTRSKASPASSGISIRRFWRLSSVSLSIRPAISRTRCRCENAPAITRPMVNRVNRTAGNSSWPISGTVEYSPTTSITPSPQAVAMRRMKNRRLNTRRAVSIGGGEDSCAPRRRTRACDGVGGPVTKPGIGAAKLRLAIVFTARHVCCGAQWAMDNATTTTPSHAPLTARQAAWVLFALSMGGFAIGTSEFVVMGLISEIARGFGVTEPQVGHVVSAYALGVVVGAPLLAILGANMRRRSLLLWLMGFYAVGNLASALSPSYHWMMLFRFIAGLPHGAYFGVAALVAAHVSPPEQRGLAVGKVMLGLSVALLVGNPLATWMGQAWSWRIAFVLVAAIALATVAMIGWRLPAG